MLNYLVGTELEIGELAESGLKRADELGLELGVDLIAGEAVGHVRANVGIEKKGVGDLVGINAGAAKRNIQIERELAVHNAEGDRVRGAELILHDLLEVEVVNALILAGIAAEGPSLADGLEQVENALAELAVEDAGLCGGVINEFAGLRADLNNLALLHDHHALTVRNGDDRAVGDDVVVALGVGGTAGNALLTLYHKHVFVHSVTIEKLFPLIGKSASDRAKTC